MLKRLFGRRNVVADRLYAGIVAQARQPGFYAGLGVPDTLDGRFELILLHAHAVLRRLGADAAKASSLGQELFDGMFADLESALREIGVSDLVVGKRVKEMGKAFYGRVAAYDEGLATDEATLAAALARNLYGTAPDAAVHAPAMARYVVALNAALAGQPVDVLQRGEVTFPPAPDASGAGVAA